MKSYKDIQQEVYQTSLLKSHGYIGPIKGVDGHTSFIKDDQHEILLDLPGNEWHYMLDGVVRLVGKLDDTSLPMFLMNTMRTEEKEDPKELYKARIYEPDGGTYSVTDKQ